MRWSNSGAFFCCGYLRPGRRKGLTEPGRMLREEFKRTQKQIARTLGP